MLQSRTAFYIMAAVSVMIALSSYRFLFLDLSTAFSYMPSHIDNRLTAFMLHISLAPIALILGVIQFSSKIRTNMPALHRWTGRIYGVCVLVSGIAGLIIAIGAEGGFVAATGFALLSLAWMFTTFIGVQHVRNCRFEEHRRWMIRSFALTLAGVTLRVQLLGFTLLGMEYVDASVYLAWLCWIPNLLVVEWWLRRGDK